MASSGKRTVELDPSGFNEMRMCRVGVAGRTDIADGLAACDLAALRQSVRIMIKVRVVVNGSVVWVELIDGRPARLALKEFDDATVSGGQHRRALWSRNVNRIVRAPLGARFAERVAQLVGTNSGNRD